MGDFNWITPSFVAFASPQHKPTNIIAPSSPEYANLPLNTSQIMASNLPTPFKNVLAHFRKRRVGLVVRLNSELYSSSYFTALGMSHINMIFEDGTCPTMQVARSFIKKAHDMIVNKNKAIAVHCKAGLGRTGCLIGAYLIYRHGFTANEVIAYMRFMRPGMVVGPQQHWLHLNQGTFRQWWFEDSFRERMATSKTSTPPRKSLVASNGQTFTPPEQNGAIRSNRKRSALGELDYNDAAPSGRDDNLPAPTPGQPRKTSKLYSTQGGLYGDENENSSILQPETEVVTVQRHVASPERSHIAPQADGESDEEYQLRVLASTRRGSRSASGSHKKRAVSCLTTTTTTEKREEWFADDDATDALMQSPSAHKTPPTTRAGVNGLSVGKRASPRKVSGNSGVRKTSGRIGSASAVSGAMRVKQ